MKSIIDDINLAYECSNECLHVALDALTYYHNNTLDYETATKALHEIKRIMEEKGGLKE